jgi:DNA invertase Pin-like site-specific DNA recombinase
LKGRVQTVATGNFVAYYRVSTDKQGRSGLGLEAQQSAVAAFLNGGTWKLVKDFTEVESGKRNDNRPKLAAAIQACRVYGAKLVIAKLDRLSRDAHFLLGLEKAGIDFVAADMPHANRLTVGVMALVAEQEATAISQRTKAALAAAKKRGVVLGGDRGVRISPRSAAKGTAALVERSEGRARDLAPVIAEIQATGAASLRDIAAALTDRNIPTARGGTEWTAMAVSRVLARIK